MKDLKFAKITLVFSVLLVLLLSTCALPVLATDDTARNPSRAYHAFYSQGFLLEGHTSAYLMDGNYMAFEFTCIAQDGGNYPVYIDLYRDLYGTTNVFTVYTDGIKRKYDGIPIGGGSDISFYFTCNANTIIFYNLVFYSWY